MRRLFVVTDYEGSRPDNIARIKSLRPIALCLLSLTIGLNVGICCSQLNSRPCNIPAVAALLVVSCSSEKNTASEKDRLLAKAVHEHKATSKRGFLERLFTFLFRGFVYPQIWEDPEVDLDALKLTKDSRIMTIASGGCNVMNYLSEQPNRIKAIDLNPAHVALLRLKVAAIKHLPDYESFFSFFGHANNKRNIENYYKYIAPNLDSFSRKHWEGWSLFDGKRINYFLS